MTKDKTMYSKDACITIISSAVDVLEKESNKILNTPAEYYKIPSERNKQFTKVNNSKVLLMSILDHLEGREVEAIMKNSDILPGGFVDIIL